MDEKKDKFTGFLKNNIETLVIVAIVLVYIMRGTASIEESGKTIPEIIADGTLAFAVGYMIKALMGKKGILAGYMSPKFLATTNSYGDQKAKISPYIEELVPFCDYKNANRLQQSQNEFLTKHAMSYNLFIKGYYDQEEDKQEVLKECRNIEIFEYTPTLLTNAYDTESSEKEILTANIKKFEKKQLTADLFIGILIFVLFGYYTLRANEFNVQGMIWASIQIVVFLGMGSYKYMMSFFFVTETLRGKIKRVMDIVDEFDNIRSKNKDVFKVKMEVQETKEIITEKEKEVVSDFNEKEKETLFEEKQENTINSIKEKLVLIND